MMLNIKRFFLSFICFLACAYSFYSISYSPLLSILKGYSSEDIAGLRDDTARARLEQQARFKLLDQRNKQQ